jgi:tetratricopeptide (TPR) repeat protein
MAGPVSRPPSVFISYSHKDEKWKDRLVRHLGVLQRQAAFDVWDDRRIVAGDDWYNEIQTALRGADLAILLVSANSLTSEFILREEVSRLLQRREREGLRIIPVVLEPCTWQKVPWICKLQLRPKDGRPLSAGRRHDVESELAAITALVDDLLRQPRTATASPPPAPDMPATGTDSPPPISHQDLRALATAQHRAGRYGEAEGTYGKLVGTLEPLLERSPGNRAYRASLADACNNFGNLLRRLGRLEKAKDCYHRALDLEEGLLADEPGNATFSDGMASTLHNLGTVLLDERLYAPAASAFQKAVATREALLASTVGQPDHPRYRRALGESCAFLGRALRNGKEREKAETAFREALQWLESIALEHPPSIEARPELAATYSALARLLAEDTPRRDREAEALFVKAAGYQRTLVEQFPDCPDFHSDLGLSIGGLARLSRERGDLPDAARQVREAIEQQTTALTLLDTGVPAWRARLKQDFKFLIAVLLEMGDFAEAARAADNVPSCLRSDPADCWELAAFLAPCVREWVKPGTSEGELQLSSRSLEDRAMSLLREAVANGYQELGSLGTDKRFTPLRGRPDFQALLAGEPPSTTQPRFAGDGAGDAFGRGAPGGADLRPSGEAKGRPE